jgi:hypothetical protein
MLPSIAYRCARPPTKDRCERGPDRELVDEDDFRRREAPIATQNRGAAAVTILPVPLETDGDSLGVDESCVACLLMRLSRNTASRVESPNTGAKTFIGSTFNGRINEPVGRRAGRTSSVSTI